MKALCIHCDPYREDPRHTFERREKYLQPLEHIIFAIVFFCERFFPWFQKGLLMVFYYFFSWIGIIQEKMLSDSDEDTLGSRARTIYHEARICGISMKRVFVCGKKVNFFSLIKERRIYIVEAGLPLVSIFACRYLLHQADDKYVLKKILKRHALPYAEGRSFFCKQKASQYGLRLGFPLVVKPRTGSLSIHVSCNIQSEEVLKEALDAAFFMSIECIVERHISGDVYRMTMVRGKMVACCRREAPNVLGDGIHTIRELIEEKNQDPRRGEMDDSTQTLHRISVTPATEALLKNKNISLDTIPSFHEKIYLHSKVILAAGADIHDVTDDVHPEMKKICEQLAQILNVPLLGFDIICADIRKNPKEQPCAVIEANTTPFIDMHHYPVTGVSRNVARVLLETQFE